MAALDYDIVNLWRVDTLIDSSSEYIKRTMSGLTLNVSFDHQQGSDKDKDELTDLPPTPR
jgi:hypothetical protein